MPFGIEAIIVSISNSAEKYRGAVDKFLIVCLVSLLVALVILFSYNVFPKIELIKFISKNISIIGAVIFGAIFLIVFPVLNIFSRGYLADIRAELSKCFYRLTKRIEGGFLSYVVTVSDDIILTEAVIDIFKSDQFIGRWHYRIKDILNNGMELTDEKMIIITDAKDELADIIKKFENNKNTILGIIISFRLTEKQKATLKSYNIEECLYHELPLPFERNKNKKD